MSDLTRAKRKKQERLEAEKKERIRLSRLYKKIFDESDDGREVFRDLMNFCMTFVSTMTGNSYTYFNEGKRAVGLHVLEMRELGIEEELTKMRAETYSKKNNEED
jgi:hypothetical protein